MQERESLKTVTSVHRFAIIYLKIKAVAQGRIKTEELDWQLKQGIHLKANARRGPS